MVVLGELNVGRRSVGRDVKYDVEQLPSFYHRESRNV